MSPPDRGWGRAVRLAPFTVLGIAVLLGGLLVRRGLRSRREAPALAAGPGRETSRSLLRQLGDLEDDLATGRVDEADYDRLRPGLERQAAAASESGEPREYVESPTVSAHRPGTHRGRWLVGAAVGLAATVGVCTLLVGALDQRAPGAVPTGDAPAAAGGRSATTADRLTNDQLATLQVAVEAVKKNPQQAATHVELARAYTEAGQPQLGAVEYLAATHLDPGNPEANTALALVAFEAGSAKQADALVSKALAAHPAYPEALYTRGLIRAMGLHQKAAATRDLKAYQKAAPLGSHRTTVATVLALLASGAIK